MCVNVDQNPESLASTDFPEANEAGGVESNYPRLKRRCVEVIVATKTGHSLAPRLTQKKAAAFMLTFSALSKLVEEATPKENGNRKFMGLHDEPGSGTCGRIPGISRW